MNLLVTGNGRSGSWKIRGEQLGAAIGATVIPKATSAEGFDGVVLVKRPTQDMLAAYRRTPIIWDVVDSHPQPIGNSWSKDESMDWLREQMLWIRPTAVVAATEAMAADMAEFEVPVLALPHHYRPGIVQNPIRDEIRKVGYEGGDYYLGKWKEILERHCRKRGWEFVINPESLSDLDIVVALREANGYPVRAWKSGVKLANAQGSGTPCILGIESGYLETQSGAECWAENEQGLATSFELLESRSIRVQTSQILRHVAPSLESIAARYRNWLEGLLCSTPSRS